MRTVFIAALALLVSTQALAGPTVPKKQLEQLPPAILSQFEAEADAVREVDTELAAARAEAEALEADRAAAKADIGDAKGDRDKEDDNAETLAGLQQDERAPC